jgi:hypothetical protein
VSGLADAGVVEDDRRVLAAHLEGDQEFGPIEGGLLDAAADRVAAGEAQALDPSVGDQRRADRAGAEHQVEHARRQAGGRRGLGVALAGQRRDVRRLDDDGVAGEERRHDVGVAQVDRIVVRADHRDHAERVVAELLVGRPGDRALAQIGGRQVAGDVEAREHGRDLLDRLALDLPGFPDDGLDQLGLAGGDRVFPPRQVGGALGQGEPRPGRGRGGRRVARSRDRAVVDRGGKHDRAVGGRVVRGERGAGRRREGAADEVAECVHRGFVPGARGVVKRPAKSAQPLGDLGRTGALASAVTAASPEIYRGPLSGATLGGVIVAATRDLPGVHRRPQHRAPLRADRGRVRHRSPLGLPGLRPRHAGVAPARAAAPERRALGDRRSRLQQRHLGQRRAHCRASAGARRRRGHDRLEPDPGRGRRRRRRAPPLVGRRPPDDRRGRRSGGAQPRGLGRAPAGPGHDAAVGLDRAAQPAAPRAQADRADPRSSRPRPRRPTPRPCSKACSIRCSRCSRRPTPSASWSRTSAPASCRSSTTRPASDRSPAACGSRARSSPTWSRIAAASSSARPRPPAARSRAPAWARRCRRRTRTTA